MALVVGEIVTRRRGLLVVLRLRLVLMLRRRVLVLRLLVGDRRHHRALDFHLTAASGRGRRGGSRVRVERSAMRSARGMLSSPGKRVLRVCFRCLGECRILLPAIEWCMNVQQSGYGGGVWAIVDWRGLQHARKED